MSQPKSAVDAGRPIHYATYFDRHYVSRGVALYRSLVRHSPPFTLWILCLDEETREALTRLRQQHVRLVPLSELERADPDLLTVKGSRLPLEYHWTCGPAFLHYLMEREPTIDRLSYCDADLFFFDNPAPLYDELGANSILLVRQRSTRPPDPRRPASTYNVGLLVFRRTTSGLACLRLWREQCLAWCFDRFEEGRHGDQGHLDDWPARFPDLAVARHTGAGVAPWNVSGIRLSQERGRVWADGAALIFYHFARIRRLNRCLYQLHDWRFHRQRPGGLLRSHIYTPYVRELSAAERHIRRTGSRVHRGTVGGRAETQAARRRLAASSALPLLADVRRFMVVVGDFTL